MRARPHQALGRAGRSRRSRTTARRRCRSTAGARSPRRRSATSAARSARRSCAVGHPSALARSRWARRRWPAPDVPSATGSTVRGEQGRATRAHRRHHILPRPELARHRELLGRRAAARAGTLARLDAGSFPQLVIRWRAGADVDRGLARGASDLRRARDPAGATTGDRPPPPGRGPPGHPRRLPRAPRRGGHRARDRDERVAPPARPRAPRARSGSGRARSGPPSSSQAVDGRRRSALIVGIPIGIVVGRIAWRAVAHGAGLDPRRATVPGGRSSSRPSPVVLVVVLAIAVFPARRMRHAPPRRRPEERVMRRLVHWTHDAKGVTMTRIDTPLELTSLRDDDPHAGALPPVGLDAPHPASRALLAIAAAALAAGDANSASVGPGRFVLLAVVVAWCVGALVTSVFRPAEPLAASMTLTGGTIALAMLGAAEAANHPTYDADRGRARDRDRRAARRRHAPGARAPRRPARRPDAPAVGARRRRARGRRRGLVHRGRGPTSRSPGSSACRPSPPRSRSPATSPAAGGPGPRPPGPGCSGRHGACSPPPRSRSARSCSTRSSAGRRSCSR